MRILCSFVILILCFNAWAQSENFEWQARSVRDDLYLTRQTEIEQNHDLEELNKKVLKELYAYSPELSTGRVHGLDYKQARSIMDNLLTHPLYVSEQQDFDTDRRLGLCFGRALFLHLELLRHGVNKDSIKKIFVIGPMSPGSGHIWQFHVATLVKDSLTNDWWALDTNAGRPLKVIQWMAEFKRFSMDKTHRIFRSPLIDRSKSLRFYVTDPQKIGPSSWEYNIRPGGLFHESYNMYFQEMFRYFKNNPVQQEKKLNSHQCQKLF